MFEKLTHRVFITIQKFLGILHSIRIYQLLEVALEVLVYRIAQVGRIRAGYYTTILTTYILGIYM